MQPPSSACATTFRQSAYPHSHASQPQMPTTDEYAFGQPSYLHGYVSHESISSTSASGAYRQTPHSHGFVANTPIANGAAPSMPQTAAAQCSDINTVSHAQPLHHDEYERIFAEAVQSIDTVSITDSDADLASRLPESSNDIRMDSGCQIVARNESGSNDKRAVHNSEFDALFDNSEDRFDDNIAASFLSIGNCALLRADN